MVKLFGGKKRLRNKNLSRFFYAQNLKGGVFYGQKSRIRKGKSRD